METPRNSMPLVHGDAPIGGTIKEIRLPILDNSHPTFQDWANEFSILLDDGSTLFMQNSGGIMGMTLKVYRLFPGKAPILLNP